SAPSRPLLPSSPGNTRWTPVEPVTTVGGLTAPGVVLPRNCVSNVVYSCRVLNGAVAEFGGALGSGFGSGPGGSASTCATLVVVLMLTITNPSGGLSLL